MAGIAFHSLPTIKILFWVNKGAVGHVSLYALCFVPGSTLLPLSHIHLYLNAALIRTSKTWAPLNRAVQFQIMGST